jgi:Domain of unknown function (DUF3291)
MPGFALRTMRALKQVRGAPGFLGGGVLPDRSFTFWTMTAWESEESMRRYMTAGAHKVAMPKLLDWCDEASVVHWEQGEDSLPSWEEADRRMRAEGRVSKVRNPSAKHATLSYRAPRTSRATRIRSEHK